MSTRKKLKELVAAKRGVIVHGAFNALSARVIADLGFEAVYVTGAGVTNMWFGLPDQGFMGLAEIADHTARMQKALTVLRDEKQVLESSGLVTPFAERQRLVGKPEWDALEKRYA